MTKPRGGQFLNRSFSSPLLDHNSSMFLQNAPEEGDKPSFSSLFNNSMKANCNNSNIQKPNIDPFPCENPSLDDDGVYLQISNLDQWYDEANLRSYLMSQLKPIAPILSLTIETPSIAKVKVPSTQVRMSLHFHEAIRHFIYNLVRQASRFASASQENGPQAHFRVIHEGQNISRVLSIAQQSRRLAERCSNSRAANVEVSRVVPVAIQVEHQHLGFVSNAGNLRDYNQQQR